MIDQTFKLLAKLAKHIANRSRDFSHMVKNPADRKRSWYKFVSCILLTLCITYIALGQEHIGSSGIALGITSSAAQAEHVEALLFFVAHNIINMCAKGEKFFPYLNGECGTVAELAEARPLTLEIVNQITAPICATQAGECNLQDWLDRHNQNQPTHGVSDNAGRFYTALAALLVATAVVIIKWVKAENAGSSEVARSNAVTPVDGDCDALLNSNSLDVDALEAGVLAELVEIKSGRSSISSDEGYVRSPASTTPTNLDSLVQAAIADRALFEFRDTPPAKLQESSPGSPQRPKALK